MEEDMVNCRFYFKIVLAAMATIGCDNPWHRSSGQPIDPKEIREYFEDFFEDIFEDISNSVVFFLSPHATPLTHATSNPNSVTDHRCNRHLHHHLHLSLSFNPTTTANSLVSGPILQPAGSASTPQFRSHHPQQTPNIYVGHTHTQHPNNSYTIFSNNNFATTTATMIQQQNLYPFNTMASAPASNRSGITTKINWLQVATGRLEGLALSFPEKGTA
ncbi:uncharacterized protein LOC111411494 [Olea europaea var. sylvestris]|uniref:uncharacterized protein LOC111411494 n=1 Tax=Olea europaea var. sylvestris TaxID=158386 RepID=UPI000C1CEB8E|nr:uncharacterized protein LOC111411494 [Olea europaea var. sylvestris]